ncbi:hypothetical protein PMAYCL1PPCAC_11192, partial [Pristionchus mayeri]
LTMKFALLLLLLVPAALAIKCWAGDGKSDKYEDKKCDASDFCFYTNKVDNDGVHTHPKGCGDAAACTNENCTPLFGGEICCCKGDHCNSAAGSSLLMTMLAAGAAAWLRN